MQSVTLYVDAERLERARSAIALAMAGKGSPATLRAYGGDLRRFFDWLRWDLAEAALLRLCDLDEAELTRTLFEFVVYLRDDRKLAPNTINRRLAAVRTLLRTARRVGLTKIDPAGLVDNVKRERVRDVRGPSLEQIELLMSALEREAVDLVGKRNRAIFRTLWENGLRRSEVEHTLIEHYDPRRRELQITRKGGRKRTVELTPKCVRQLDAYLEERFGRARPDNGLPLFASGATNRVGDGLTDDGLYEIVKSVTKRVLGRAFHPHAIRHSAATVHYKLTKDLVATQRFLDHASSRTTEEYLDVDGRELQIGASNVLSKAA